MKANGKFQVQKFWWKLFELKLVLWFRKFAFCFATWLAVDSFTGSAGLDHQVLHRIQRVRDECTVSIACTCTEQRAGSGTSPRCHFSRAVAFQI